MSKNKDIREAVEAEIAFDPFVDDSQISVQNVGGAIALHGTVPSYSQHLEAGRAARRVYGVSTVHNHLDVVLSDEDYRDDAILTTDANNALAVDVTTPAGIEATARDGVVTLKGVVAYGSQRLDAEDTVSGLRGVRKIRNDIAVVSDADPRDVVDNVKDALDRHALVLDDSDLLVTTEDRTVNLVGHVRTWAEHDAVVYAAWMTDGVYDVQDDLVVTG